MTKYFPSLHNTNNSRINLQTKTDACNAESRLKGQVDIASEISYQLISIWKQKRWVKTLSKLITKLFTKGRWTTPGSICNVKGPFSQYKEFLQIRNFYRKLHWKLPIPPCLLQPVQLLSWVQVSHGKFFQLPYFQMLCFQASRCMCWLGQSGVSWAESQTNGNQ